MHRGTGHTTTADDQATVEVIYGEMRERVLAERLAEAVRKSNVIGTLYLGYPVLASADDRVYVDALLVCREHGVVAFSITSELPASDTDWAQCVDEQDRLFFVVKNHLERRDGLRRGRQLVVPVEAMTVFPRAPKPPPDVEGRYCDVAVVAEEIRSLASMAPEHFGVLEAAVQRVTTIKPPKRRTQIEQKDSRGAMLKQIERSIANLDQWQKQAAIEMPDGPQRIRGLAGSGKTVVLALKAAYLHAMHPDWTIAVSFYTRALYQQLEDLIERFSFEHLNDKPDWTRLRLLHAWGGREREGIYTDIANACGQPARDFLYARNAYGMHDAFRGVCTELLAKTAQPDLEPLYDAVLIDEAQDLPREFFQLVYRFTRPPKRITWAYDELQTLSDAMMPSTTELFGTDEQGQPRVHLVTRDGQPRQDITLPVCYRNTPWALTLAHALGLGIYCHDGLVQHFDESGVWAEVGYQLLDGELRDGERVLLERRPDSYPEYFKKLLDRDDAVQLQHFADDVAQDYWVAAQIQHNLQEDELDPDDILIVLPNVRTAKTRAAALVGALRDRNIQAHLAGVHTSLDQIFDANSVAIANIYRAKGNEAGMVYVLDSQYGVSAGLNAIARRNTLFTAITRSRAWVRLCGYGDSMAEIAAEFDAVKRNQYRLDFVIPTPAQRAEMRQIHRDRTAEERAKAEKAHRGLQAFLDGFRRGDVAWEQLSPGLRTQLAKLAAAQGRIDNGEE